MDIELTKGESQMTQTPKLNLQYLVSRTDSNEVTHKK